MEWYNGTSMHVGGCVYVGFGGDAFVVVLRNLVQLYTCIIYKTHNNEHSGTGLRPTYINTHVLTSSIQIPLAPL